METKESVIFEQLMETFNFIEESAIKSFLGPGKSCKYIENGGSLNVVGCILTYLIEVPLNCPLKDVLLSCVESYHKQFGCGSTTMCALTICFYKAITKRKLIIDENRNELFEELENLLQSLIESLRQIVQSCKKKLNSFVENRTATQLLLRCSRHLQTSTLHKNDIINASIPKMVKIISHGNEWASTLITKAWQLQVENEENFIFDTNRVSTLTMSAPSFKSCVVSGLLFPITYDSASVILQEKKWRALLVNSNVTSTFVHKGVNLKINKSDVKSIDDIHFDQVNRWMTPIVEAIKSLNINLLLVSGKVEDKLKSTLTFMGIVVVENIRAGNLDIIATQYESHVATYIKDCDEDNVTNVDVDYSFQFFNSCDKFWIRLGLTTSVQTVVICHPVTSFLSHLEHQFWHQAHRLSSITKNDLILPGGCRTEQFVLKQLQLLKHSESFSETWAKEILNEGFNSYINTTEINLSSYELTDDVSDDYNGKVNGWISALRSACHMSRIDYVITTGDLNNIESFPENFCLGKL